MTAKAEQDINPILKAAAISAQIRFDEQKRINGITAQVEHIQSSVQEFFDIHINEVARRFVGGPLPETEYAIWSQTIDVIDHPNIQAVVTVKQKTSQTADFHPYGPISLTYQFVPREQYGDVKSVSDPYDIFIDPENPIRTEEENIRSFSQFLPLAEPLTISEKDSPLAQQIEEAERDLKQKAEQRERGKALQALVDDLDVMHNKTNFIWFLPDELPGRSVAFKIEMLPAQNNSFNSAQITYKLFADGRVAKPDDQADFEEIIYLSRHALVAGENKKNIPLTDKKADEYIALVRWLVNQQF